MEKLYNNLDEPRCAYLLRKGNVYFEIQDGELYKITGKNSPEYISSVTPIAIILP